MKPPSLKETQRLFADVVLTPLDPDFRTRAISRSGKDSGEIGAQLIRSTDKLSGLNRLEIYNKQYWFRLLDCLYDDFPGVRNILGDKRFRELSVAYLQKYPSKSYSLRDLGEHLSEFLSREPQWLGRRKRLVLDMAQLEWAHIVAFDGAQGRPLQSSDLEGIDITSLKVTLQPYMTLLDLHYPLDEFILALRKQERSRGGEGGTVEEKESHDELRRVLPGRKATRLVVHRIENVIYYKRIEIEQFRLLAALHSGRTLQEACSEAFLLRGTPSPARLQTISQNLKEWFLTWSRLGWFVKADNLPPTM